MPRKKHPSAPYIRTVVAVAVGLLTWTLSIQLVPIALDAQPIELTRCNTDQTTQDVFHSMLDGIVTHVHNDGALLSIGIGNGWDALSHESRQRLYLSLQCLAKQHNVAFRILPSNHAAS